MLSFDYKTERIQRLKDCNLVNQRFLNQIVAEYQSMFQTEQLADGNLVMRPERISPQDIDKMRSTLRSFVREWASEG